MVVEESMHARKDLTWQVVWPPNHILKEDRQRTFLFLRFKKSEKLSMELSTSRAK